MRGRGVSAIIALVGFLGAIAASADQSICQSLLTPTKYSISVKAQYGNQIQFGFESEYTKDELEHIVKYYRPKSVAGGTWLSRSVEDRVKFVQEKVMRMVVHAEDSGLVRNMQVEAPDFLPKALAIDSTGNIEFILPPMDSYSDYRTRMTYINETFGVGSMQSTISTPMKSFYRFLPADHFIGFLKFYSDFDTLEKIAKASSRYKSKPDSDTLRSFMHPFLGPMTQMKMNHLEKYVRGNSEGKLLDKGSLRFIKAEDSSFKYYGGTAYRPDLAGPERIVLEVRDAHKDESALITRVERISRYFQEMPTNFVGFSSLKTFDSQADFAKLPKHLQDMLQNAFPSRAYAGVEYTPEELTANEVGRNFAWPLRDWSAHVQLLNLRQADVMKAQNNYIQRLQAIFESVERGLDIKAARYQIQGALGLFVDETKLFEIFQSADEVLTGLPRIGKAS